MDLFDQRWAKEKPYLETRKVVYMITVRVNKFHSEFILLAYWAEKEKK